MMSCGVIPRIARLRHAEELVQVRGVSAAHLERPVDVADAVRIAVDEDVDGDLLLVGEPPDEPPARARRHAAHRDEDAVRRLPVVVFDEPLEHPRRLDHQDEIGVGLEREVLDRDRDRVGAAPELRAVDLELLPGVPVLVDDDELPRHLAALLLGDEAELLAVELEEGLDVVHHRVGLGLLVEARVVPVLRDVVRLSLGGDVVGLDELLGERHHAERLREGLDRVHGERALLLAPAHLEVAARDLVLDVGERAQRELHRRAFAVEDRPLTLCASVLIFLRQRFRHFDLSCLPSRGSSACRVLGSVGMGLDGATLPSAVWVATTSPAVDRPSQNVRLFSSVSLSVSTTRPSSFSESARISFKRDPDVRDVLLDVGALLRLFLRLRPAPDETIEPPPALLEGELDLLDDLRVVRDRLLALGGERDPDRRDVDDEEDRSRGKRPLGLRDAVALPRGVHHRMRDRARRLLVEERHAVGEAVEPDDLVGGEHRPPYAIAASIWKGFPR